MLDVNYKYKLLDPPSLYKILYIYVVQAVIEFACGNK